MFYYDYYYLILIIPAMIFAGIAQMKVSSTFNKYSSVKTIRGYTGAEAAEYILKQNGLYDVRVERVSGHLSDHFDPRSKIIRLSDSVYSSSSIAAVGVAAHEAGHAVQYGANYSPVKIRTAILPVTQLSSKLAIPVLLIGMVLSVRPLFIVGIILFGVAAIFQIVTLPVEFNASSRALGALASSEMLTSDESRGAKKVLDAAALTYVAALVVTIAQLLRFILLFNNRNRND